MDTKQRLENLVGQRVKVKLEFGPRQTKGTLIKIRREGSRYPSFYSVGNPDRGTFIPFRPSGVIAIDEGKQPTLILVRQEYTGG